MNSIPWIWRWAVTDLRDFKVEMYKLIDAAHEYSLADFTDAVAFEIKEARVGLSVNDFARHVHLLAKADNAKRARKLVDVLDDISLTANAERLAWCAGKLFQLALAAAFVVFVVLVYTWVS